jgi:hypothetical protein
MCLQVIILQNKYLSFRMCFYVICKLNVHFLIYMFEKHKSALHLQCEYSSLQGKFHLCITFLGIARPQPQFQHSCV